MDTADNSINNRSPYSSPPSLPKHQLPRTRPHALLTRRHQQRTRRPQRITTERPRLGTRRPFPPTRPPQSPSDLLRQLRQLDWSISQLLHRGIRRWGRVSSLDQVSLISHHSFSDGGARADSLSNSGDGYIASKARRMQVGQVWMGMGLVVLVGGGGLIL
jgi:hypothetical protein